MYQITQEKHIHGVCQKTPKEKPEVHNIACMLQKRSIWHAKPCGKQC